MPVPPARIMESKAAPTAPAAPAAASGAATTAASASGRPPTSTTSSAEAREAEIVRVKSISAALSARLSKSKRELDGTIVGFETVPVKRLRLYDARRSPDFGLFMDVKPDHGVVEKVVGHHRNAAGDLAFTVKWAGRAGEAATSTAELQTLMRNCQGMLRSYCKAKSIPWSHLLLQRREHNRAIKAE